MKAQRSSLLVATALFVAACQNVDYIDIKPKTLVLQQKTDQIWLQGHPMSHTGVHYSRVDVGWSTKDPSIAVVDEKGRLTPVKSGQTEVIATVGKVTATAPVEVLFAEKLLVDPTQLTLTVGQPSVELKVKVFDYLGRPLADRTATYRTQNKEVVSMGQNAVFPLGPGKTQVDVQVESLKQTVEVTVLPEGKAAAAEKTR